MGFRWSTTGVGLVASLLAPLLYAPSAAADDDGTNLYGYLAWRVEKVWDELSVDGAGNTVTEDAPREISLPFFHIMVQEDVGDDFRFFFNLAGGGAEDLEVRNVWGEWNYNQYLNVRLGKMYRRFGLYNEILDAVPTYIGIEPPELFDNDHLILSRTTNAMVHGWIPLGDGELNYAVTLDNGEGGPTPEDNFPLGFDLRYSWGFGNYVVGVSGYSSGGDTTSDVGLGEGSPNSGVLPWMAADDFSIFGAFGEFQIDNWLIQAEYWNASHDAVRDPDSVVTVVNQAGVNDAQRARFLIDPTGPVDVANVNTNGDYDVNTWYIRTGYSFLTSKGEIQPYFQWDYYENPETIENKTFGGDAEAGLADNGEFVKWTLGVIYRPIPEVAFKLDTSTHIQDFNGREETYPEIRFDVSYIFGR
jgi:hypothetical protein